MSVTLLLALLQVGTAAPDPPGGPTLAGTLGASRWSRSCSRWPG